MLQIFVLDERGVRGPTVLRSTWVAEVQAEKRVLARRMAEKSLENILEGKNQHQLQLINEG